MACIPGCDRDEAGSPEPLPPAPGSDPLAAPQRAGWPITDTVATGADWTSGYYLVEFVLTTGPDAGEAASTYVILREPRRESPSLMLVQVPVNTWEAYNEWGGASLYDFDGPRAYRVSFDRPYGYRAQSPLWWELQLVRFLEREGYDVSYQTDLDTHEEPTSLLRHQLVLTAGHDEYWSKEIRDAFDAAVAHGTNIAIMGSNTGYWQIRYEDAGRTILSYKSLYDPNPIPELRTAMFREIGRPECELEGVQHQFIRPSPGPLDYTATQAAATDPWFRLTGLSPGDRIAGVVGDEYDVLNPYPAACAKPGLLVLFHYQGFPDRQNADAVRYTAPSGARVFASGAQRFSWGLDGWRPPPLPAGTADPRLQRFMRNALADLARPGAPQGVTARRHGGGTLVSVTSTRDLRIRGMVVFRIVQGDFARACSGVRFCVDPIGADGYAVFAVNRWHRWSAPTYTRRSAR
jgi:hypothetical protein